MSSSETNSSDGPAETPVLEGGVLAALPRARPQRGSPRRDAARAKAGKRDTVASPDQLKTTRTKSTKQSTQSAAPNARVGQAKAKTASSPAKSRVTPTPAKTPTTTLAETPFSTRKAKASSVKAKAKSASAKPAEPPAPKQGYEPEEEFELGNTVDPPSGVEVVESVADIVGELANSGLAAGGRILKDAFALLRRP